MNVQNEHTGNEHDVLEAVFHTADMGRSTIETLLEKSQDGEFSEQLRQEQKYFDKAANDARQLMAEAGIEPKKTPFADAMTAMGVRMNTMTDDSSSHMAQMMIEGHTMGIVELTRRLNRTNAGGPGERMAKEMIRFEEKSAEELKRYL